MASTARMGVSPIGVEARREGEGGAGVKEVERQLRVPCDEPRFEEPRVER